MLDTNMVSYIVRGRSIAATHRLLALDEKSITCISAITEAEIAYGLAKRPEATALRSLMYSFLANISVAPWSSEEAQSYGRLRAALEKRGGNLANMDMMIAAHAMTLDAVLVTNDQAFAQVAELHATANWATDL